MCMCRASLEHRSRPLNRCCLKSLTRLTMRLAVFANVWRQMEHPKLRGRNWLKSLYAALVADDKMSRSAFMSLHHRLNVRTRLLNTATLLRFIERYKYSRRLICLIYTIYRFHFNVVTNSDFTEQLLCYAFPFSLPNSLVKSDFPLPPN